MTWLPLALMLEKKSLKKTERLEASGEYNKSNVRFDEVP